MNRTFAFSCEVSTFSMVETKRPPSNKLSGGTLSLVVIFHIFFAFSPSAVSFLVATKSFLFPLGSSAANICKTNSSAVIGSTEA